MPAGCEGYSRRPGTKQLFPCPYAPGAHSPYCFFHEMVAAGNITDASWKPGTKVEAAERRPLDRLLEEWDVA